MALPSLRNRPLSVRWAKIWSFADITVQALSSLILLIHFILEHEAMLIFMAILSMWYFWMLLLNHNHLSNLAQYRVHLLAHTKNLMSFLNIIVFIYLCYRSFKSYDSGSTSIIYFMFAYIVMGVYNIVAYVTSFMMLGSTEIQQPFGANRSSLYLDYYPVVYCKGRVYEAEEYNEEFDWVTSRGLNQNKVGKVKALPVYRTNVQEEKFLDSNTPSRTGRTFTTMNSDMRSREEGISMGSKISNEMKKPAPRNPQTKNLTEDQSGTQSPNLTAKTPREEIEFNQKNPKKKKLLQKANQTSRSLQ